MNQQSRLTFEEFRKLPRSEQNVRYKDLSDHDRFLARMNDHGTTRDTTPLTEERFLQIGRVPGSQDVMLCLLADGLTETSFQKMHPDEQKVLLKYITPKAFQLISPDFQETFRKLMK